jgi:hypothetical protein
MEKKLTNSGPLREPADKHSIYAIKQRVLPIAAGYEDANDANTLRHNPLFKLLLDRLPENGPPLASQPTLSRVGNRVSANDVPNSIP